MSSTTLALVLMLHTASGGYVETPPVEMPADQCLALMRQVWSQGVETVALDDENRPLPAIDAACLPVTR